MVVSRVAVVMSGGGGGGRVGLAALLVKRTASFADFNDVTKRTFRIVTDRARF